MRPPLKHVERAQRAGDLVGVVEGRRQGGAEADVPGDARHHRQHRQRIEKPHLATAAQNGVEVATVVVEEAQGVSEETGSRTWRLRACGRTGRSGRAFQGIVEHRLRMAPSADMTGGRAGLGVGDEMHLTSDHCNRTLPAAAATAGQALRSLAVDTRNGVPCLFGISGISGGVFGLVCVLVRVDPPEIGFGSIRTSRLAVEQGLSRRILRVLPGSR